MNDNKFRLYDDVIQARRAIRTVAMYGIARWTAGAINSREVHDVQECRNVAARGLAEIEDFLRDGGWL